MDILFPSPAASFDHPFEMLDGCHERIRRQCATIAAIATHVIDHGVDDEARGAARGVVRFFETAGANHHRDEENDLFPALLQHVPGAELNAALSIVTRLRHDHRRLDALWVDMRARLARVAEGEAAELPLEVVECFAAAYERHIALEETHLLPMARRVLDDRLVGLLGARMARRRGVAVPA